MATKQRKTRPRNAEPEDSPYTTKIIKAGALLADTKTLLAHWDLDRSVQDNLHRIQHENIFGKASRSRVDDILRIFRQRYLTEEAVTRTLVVLVKNRAPPSALDRILYFHSAQSNRLLFDVVVNVHVPQQTQERPTLTLTIYSTRSPSGCEKRRRLRSGASTRFVE